MVKNKYNNKKIEYLGVIFDSKMELEYYKFLLNFHDKESIKLQPEFILLDKFTTADNEKIRGITYKADFKIGNRVYDVKGFTTPDFLIKAKLFKFRYPTLQLMLVTKAPIKYGGNWVTLEELKKLKKPMKCLKI